ncbi:hypothetical protein GCM10010974_32020 [Brevibacterium sediminis]|uniref:Uncharacterized protein n=1 Tax=Brevibacterium sediminis TaxID=1857024 RepID=A0ABQ1MV09_9MICO|nr:hypothetical protein GCM10010974_32020 [Brevibacterium sediminis]
MGASVWRHPYAFVASRLVAPKTSRESHTLSLHWFGVALTVKDAAGCDGGMLRCGPDAAGRWEGMGQVKSFWPIIVSPVPMPGGMANSAEA